MAKPKGMIINDVERCKGCELCLIAFAKMFGAKADTILGCNIEALHKCRECVTAMLAASPKVEHC